MRKDYMMNNKCGGNTPIRRNSLSEVFFSNPSAIRMAPSSPISPFPALQHTSTTTTSIYHPQ
jgi:hypothetical protein